MPARKYPCNGTSADGEEVCQELVAARRPSDSGMHWCPKPMCQAAKQRWHRASRKAELEAARTASVADSVVLDQAGQAELKLLVHKLARGEQGPCSTCGFDRAIPGFAHPDPRQDRGTGDPCFAQGGSGRMLQPLGLLRIAYSMDA